MFCLHEKVVYPGQGVARIDRLVKKTMGGQEITFYELTFLHKEVTVLVPTESAESVGLRALSSPDHIQDAFKLFEVQPKKLQQYEFSATNWNKRNKEYQLKLRTGSLRDLLEIYRDLRIIAQQKELSFGEKNLLSQTESLIVEEIALVEHVAQEKAIEQLRSMCVFAVPKSTLSQSQPY